MSIDAEFAIRKDIRNNPVIREIDVRQRREYRHTVLLVVLGVVLLLFWTWQHYEMVNTGYSTQDLRQKLSEEQALNRKLRLNLEALEAPQRIEAQAREHGLGPASQADTLVIERVPASTPLGNVVARAR